MADLDVIEPIPRFDPIVAIGKDELVEGGIEGPANRPIIALANQIAFVMERTYSKDDVDLQQDNLYEYVNKKTIDYNFVVNVGVNEEVKTINEALQILTKNKPGYVIGDHSLKAKIVLKSGFIAKEQINIQGLDLSWIDLTSEDPSVVVDRESLIQKDDRWFYFIRCKNGAIPNIDVLFDMNKTGTSTGKTHLYMNHSRGFINPGKGFINAGERNVDLTQVSTLCCARGIFTGAGVLNFRPATGSIVFMQFADVSNAPTGLSTSTGATVSAANLICSGCNTGASVQCATADFTDAIFSNISEMAIHASTSGSKVNAPGINISSAKYAIYAADGANVGAPDAIINDCTIAGIVAITGATVSAPKAKLLNNKTGVISSSGSTVIISDGSVRGSQLQSLVAQTGGNIIANNTDYRRGEENSNIDAQVLTNGTITAIGSTGGVSQKTDVLTNNGLIAKGIRSRSTGTAVIQAGTKEVIVSHGLGGTPSVVFASPNLSIAPANSFWAGVRTETTFKISVDVELAQALQFYWSAEI